MCKVISFDWQDDTGNALWICTNISSKVQGYDRCWAYRRYLSRSFLNVFASAIWFFGFLLTFVQLRAFMSICLCFSSFPSGVTCGTKDPHAPFHILCWSWKVFFVLDTDISINSNQCEVSQKKIFWNFRDILFFQGIFFRTNKEFEGKNLSILFCTFYVWWKFLHIK